MSKSGYSTRLAKGNRMIPRLLHDYHHTQKKLCRALHKTTVLHRSANTSGTHLVHIWCTFQAPDQCILLCVQCPSCDEWDIIRFLKQRRVECIFVFYILQTMLEVQLDLSDLVRMRKAKNSMKKRNSMWLAKKYQHEGIQFAFLWGIEWCLTH